MKTENKFKKQNGFPTRYAYACGYGKTFEKDEDNRISLFENDSHTCFDIKGFKNGSHFWEQFFHWDGQSTKKAEKRFNEIKRKMVL